MRAKLVGCCCCPLELFSVVVAAVDDADADGNDDDGCFVAI